MSRGQHYRQLRYGPEIRVAYGSRPWRIMHLLLGLNFCKLRNNKMTNWGLGALS